MSKFNILISVLLYVLLLLSSRQSFGSDIKFYHLNTSDGLGQNTVNFIHQDNEGFFWFGTNGGLSRWNGYNFTTYIHSSTDSLTIGQGRINCLHEDENGEIWIGTYQGGVSKYNRLSNTFTNYYNFDAENRNDQTNNIQQINKYKNVLTVATFGNGLYFLDTKTQKFIPIKVYDENNKLLDKFIVHKMLVDKDSTLWLGYDRGLIKIPNQSWNTDSPELHGTELLPGENVLSLYRDSKNRVWIGTHYSGAFVYDLQTQTLSKFRSGNLSNGVGFPIIRDFNEDKYQNLWIATGGDGIIIIDNKTQLLKYYKSELNNSSSLSSNIIYCLYADNNKNMWAGTYNSGINYTSNYKQSFNHVRGYGGIGELKNNAILSLCELSNNKILVGTDGDGISIFDPAKNTFEPLPLNKKDDLLKIIAPVAIVKDNLGNIFIGTYINGLYVYNEKTGKISNYKAGLNEHDLKSNDIWAITVAENNKIWIGTLGKGIAKFEPSTGKFYDYTTNLANKHSISEDYISNLLIDHENKLWVATYNGGINLLIDEEKGIFKSFKKGDSSGLSSNEIWKLFEDSKQNLWVATHDGGVCLLDRKTMTFKTLTIADGLPSNSAQSIIEDKNGDIWIGSNNGLSKITLTGDTLTIKNFTDRNGLQSNEFSTNAAMQTKNDILYFGGTNGFNFFNPDSIGSINKVGSLHITDFAVFYHGDKSGVTNSIFYSRNSTTNTIELKYNIAVVAIEYALLDYTIPELNTYKYKLEGFDKTWVNAGNNRKVTYTNLNPGTYTFKVKGTNSLGIENPNEQTITFVIQPPIWKRPWFISTYIIFFIFLTIVFYNYKVRSYRLHETELKNKVDERTTELVNLNNLLADRNQEIKLQSEELKTKSEHLIEVNANLENSYEKIEKQNIELEHHRNNLELLVEKRTEELEYAKRKAEESERLKMAFLSNMSHEIRTPMNAIVGFSSLLSVEGYSTEEKQSFSDLINSNSNSLLLLIDDILDLSRIEANQLKIIKTKINFVEIYNETVANWSIIKKEKFPDVVFEYKNEIPTTELFTTSDYTRIKQIISNLLDNAFKFTCAGTVRFNVWIDHSLIITCVEDTGIGISPENQSIIFDRFRKSEESLEKSFRGAGLGLTISKKLALLLKGDLWVESDYGKGSKFYFMLPIQ